MPLLLLHTEPGNALQAEVEIDRVLGDERKPKCASCEARGAFVNEPVSPASKSSDTNSNCNGTSRSGSDSLPQGTRNHHSSSITIDSLLTTPPSVEECKRQRPLVDWHGYFDTRYVSAGGRHGALLRHFRYMMVPWIEAGDCLSRFGVDVMYFAQEHPFIQDVIIELAADQTNLMHHNRDAADRLKDKARIHALDGPARRVADSLLGITDYLRSGPLRWRSCLMYEMGLLSSELAVLSVEEPLQSLCKLHSRFDLASSILLRQHPLTPRSFYSPQGFPPAWDLECPRATYLWSLYHLTITLHFLHGPAQPFTQPLLQDSPHQTLSQFPSAPNSSAQWLAIWQSCQTWRDKRPLPMRPILDIGNIEAGQIDTRADASFPIQLYTNALAIQANINYHMCSLLLLTTKPRLLKLPGHQLFATSQSWHVQTIAGIACTNEFPEQWDPILIAALLFVSGDMTHPSQQNAMRVCFRKIRTATGIALDREVSELESLWAVGRLG
ncbi:hypothetical protein ED733_004106 [Metarhizium rileyi]|uniref:Transcription factor n=1 Tax=Metarhizium rileyi (strain RCEF 4871) TaxID=1649241 RepID=A0A5C6GNV6_METRR|nr:hypothetical protein ED733_004106 [Metarhizium rileyi]